MSGQLRLIELILILLGVIAALSVASKLLTALPSFLALGIVLAVIWSLLRGPRASK
jgi:hypothetical protein